MQLNQELVFAKDSLNLVSSLNNELEKTKTEQENTIKKLYEMLEEKQATGNQATQLPSEESLIFNAQILDLSTRNKELQQELEDLKNQLPSSIITPRDEQSESELSKKLSETQAQILELVESLENTRKINSNLEILIEQLNTELKTQTMKASLLQEKEAQITEIQMALSEDLEKRKTLEELLSKQSQELEEAQENLSNMQTTYSQMEANLKQLQIVNKELEAEDRAKLESESRANSKLRVQLEKLKTKLKSKDAELESVNFHCLLLLT